MPKKFKLPKKTIVLIAAAFTLAAALSCAAPRESSRSMGMAVTIAPQAEFARALAGGLWDITVMVPPGASPHTYEPAPSQIEALSKAAFYAKVGSGVEFELAWMDKLEALNTEMSVVDCHQGIELIEMTAEDEHEGHEHAEAHEHGSLDPHIWMSPRNAVIMVKNMTEGFISADPGNETLYRRNSESYSGRLEQLDRDITDGLAEVQNRTFMVYHPAFGYFARDYGLTMLPIEEEGKEPTPAGLASVIEQARSNSIKVIFASPQFNPQSAEVIAGAIEGTVVFIDPLAENYIENLRAMAQQVIESME